MTQERATTSGTLNARIRYETLERRLIEEDGNLTTEDFRNLIFLDFAENNNHYMATALINSLNQVVTKEQARDISWYSIITESMRLSYENTKNAIHMAFTAMVSMQQDLKEIAAVYRNIKTDEQARAYGVLKAVGLKRYLPDIDTDNSGFSFNRHTATMVLNIIGTMTRIQHYNAMVKTVAEWSGVKRMNEARLPDLKKQIEELNTLTDGVMEDVENCPLLEQDKADANTTYENGTNYLTLVCSRPTEAIKSDYWTY